MSPWKRKNTLSSLMFAAGLTHDTLTVRRVDCKNINTCRLSYNWCGEGKHPDTGRFSDHCCRNMRREDDYIMK